MPDDSAANASSPLQDALVQLQAGDLDAAERALRGILEINPSNLDAKMWLSEVLFRQGDVDGAAAQLKAIVASNPDYARAHHALGRYHYINKNYDASEAAARKAIELDPTLYSAWLDIADLSILVRQDPAKAITHYRGAIQAKPDHAGAHFGLGRALELTGDYKGAEAAWRRSHELDGKTPLPMYSLGNMLVAQRKLQEALDAYGLALDAEPRHIESMAARGNILAAMRKPQMARQEFERIVALAPEDTGAHLKIAMLWQQQGQDQKAINGYRRVLELNADHPLAHNNLAWLLLEREALKESLHHARRATDIAPNTGAYWDTLGWIQHHSGENTAALASLEKAIGLQEQAITYSHLAQVHVALGNEAEANTARQKAQELTQGEG